MARHGTSHAGCTIYVCSGPNFPSPSHRDCRPFWRRQWPAGSEPGPVGRAAAATSRKLASERQATSWPRPGGPGARFRPNLELRRRENGSRGHQSLAAIIMKVLGSRELGTSAPGPSHAPEVEARCALPRVGCRPRAQRGHCPRRFHRRRPLPVCALRRRHGPLLHSESDSATRAIGHSRPGQH